MNSIWATIHDGRIEPSEPVDLPEGARALVTLMPDDEGAFWSGASEDSLAAVWDNTEDDVYAQLLEE
jgi:hypothetical protein